ncbi:MAG TPA: glycosyltransferase family 4 protein [Candidatus Peribacteraceae bacterium]|nr:glycosyltransferase family 4 protein [Candidatus Peribacteraceae bacterium]
MRIVLLTPDLTGKSGWSRYALDLGKALASRGHELHAVVSGKTGATWCREHVLLQAPTTYLDNAIMRWIDAMRLAHLLQKITPGVVHVIAEPYALLLQPHESRKTFMTIHGTYSTAPFQFGAKTAARFADAYRWLNGVIAVSHFTKQHVKEEVGSLWDEAHLEMKIRVIHNAVDISDMDRWARPAPGVQKTILSVSAIKKKKGYLQSIAALAAFRHAHPDVAVQYDIVGSLTVNSAFVAELRAAIEKHRLQDIVSLRGGVSDDELRDAYLSADVFLLPSMQEGHYFEGFGLVFLEANMYGTPVIGPTGGGCPEAIKDGVSGYVVDPMDIDAIVDRLKKILLHRTIDPQACRAWTQRHDIRRAAETIERLYLQ